MVVEVDLLYQVLAQIFVLSNKATFREPKNKCQNVFFLCALSDCKEGRRIWVGIGCAQNWTE